MDEHILFLTGRLAHDSLCREIEGLTKRSFSYRVHQLGLQVAGLMTADMIRRRLPAPVDAHRIVVPGLCGGEVEALSDTYRVPVERGPKDLKDLPEYFGTAGRRPDLSEHRVVILAEIVDAPHMGVGQILDRAAAYRTDGADVIDLGCLPGVAFPHLEESVAALKHAGHAVSVDSLETPELRRGAAAGADYLLSLNESTLHLTHEWDGTPVLIPERPADLDSLYRAAETLAARGRRFLLDPILEPIHFGFTESLLRYHAVRRRFPEAEIMMGIGNITELTDADTTGINAVLMGVVSELDIGAVLTTEVSPHAHTSVREVDIARRVMWAAKRDGSLPRRYHGGLMALKDRKPFPHTCEEVAQNRGRDQGPQLSHPAHAGRHPRLQPRRPAARHRSLRAVSGTRGGRGREPRVLPGGGARPSSDSVAAREAVPAGQRAGVGGCGPQRRRRVIHETIITTLNADGTPHVAPMGVRTEGGLYRIAPFRPSRTLENVLRSGQAVINYTDDVRIFAGFHTGRRIWPTVPAGTVGGVRLAQALAHVEVEVARWEDDEVRPRVFCRELARETHAAFRGFNRAQAAVVEAAILVSRLGRLPAEKVDREMSYLRIAVEKTAGEHEREAWGWLIERIANHRRSADGG